MELQVNHLVACANPSSGQLDNSNLPSLLKLSSPAVVVVTLWLYTSRQTVYFQVEGLNIILDKICPN